MKRKHLFFAASIASFAAPAHASFLSGDTLDAAADVLAWIVLIVAPIVAIGVFLMVHILPEKVAEKRHHPQLNAIKTLCILSLFFGGMLWPIAWIWAYTKPVLHRMAYGTDAVELEREPPKELESKQALLESNQRVVELEHKLEELQRQVAASAPPNGTGKFTRWLTRLQARHEHSEET